MTKAGGLKSKDIRNWWKRARIYWIMAAGRATAAFSIRLADLRQRLGIMRVAGGKF